MPAWSMAVSLAAAGAVAGSLSSQIMAMLPLESTATSGARVWRAAAETRTMPLGNLTGMTDAERDTLGAWLAGLSAPR